jgi:hypothetical protein
MQSNSSDYESSVQKTFKQSREHPPALFVWYFLGNGSGLTIPALVREGVLSPGERISTPGTRLNNWYYCPWTCLVVANTYLIVARAAINGAIILGQEWNLCLSTTLSASDCVHLAWSTLAMVWASWRRATSCAARSTTTRLIHQTFLLVELLFTGSEYEIVSALTTPQGFVYEVQLETSSMICWYSPLVHILANVTSHFSPTSVGFLPWKSIVCETEIGYRLKAYIIFWGFARVFIVISFCGPYFYVSFIYAKIWNRAM